jgi:8-oxo-dGTP pyrophosphatase MutT (NUDIX family)
MTKPISTFQNKTLVVPGPVLTKDLDAAPQYAVLPWRKAECFEILLITSRKTVRWVIPKGGPILGLTSGETAGQEAYEEAGVRGQMSAQAIGHYGYRKRLRDGAKKRFRVDVFAMEVTEVLDLWPEAPERKRQWFSPAEAAVRVYSPKLAILIRTFSEDQLEQKLPAPRYSQAIWRILKFLFRSCGPGKEPIALPLVEATNSQQERYHGQE